MSRLYCVCGSSGDCCFFTLESCEKTKKKMWRRELEKLNRSINNIHIYIYIHPSINFNDVFFCIQFFYDFYFNIPVFR